MKNLTKDGALSEHDLSLMDTLQNNQLIDILRK